MLCRGRSFRVDQLDSAIGFVRGVFHHWRLLGERLGGAMVVQRGSDGDCARVDDVSWLCSQSLLVSGVFSPRFDDVLLAVLLALLLVANVAQCHHPVSSSAVSQCFRPVTLSRTNAVLGLGASIAMWRNTANC